MGAERVAVERRSRCPSTSASLPSSLTSNSTLPRNVVTTAGRSQILATGWSSPLMAARLTAAATTASAAAIANRAETPDRASTAGELRTSLVNLAITSIRCLGRTASALSPPQAISDSCLTTASSSSSDNG